MIVERFHRVFFGPQILLTVGVGELDAERCRSIDGHAAGCHLLAAGLKRHRLTVGEHNATSGQGLACGHHHFNFGAFQGDHIGSILFLLYSQSGIAGIVIRVIQLFHPGEICNIDREFFRLVSTRFHKVMHGFLQIKNQVPESGNGLRRHFHGRRFPLRAVRIAQMHFGALGIKALRNGLNHNVAAACHRGIARRDLQLIGIDRGRLAGKQSHASDGEE